MSRPRPVPGRRARPAGPRAAAAGALAAALSLAAPGPAPAQEAPYRLQPGDVIAISVAGLPALDRRAEIQLDGAVPVPMIGETPAAGRTLAELREALRTALAGRLLPTWTPDGRERLQAVSREQVGVWVAEHRPVFVSGDVARPGALPFRPGMTARQALAAAGGLMRPAPQAGLALDPEALRIDHAAAWLALAAADARIWRLRRELAAAGAPEPAAEVFAPASPPPDAASAAALARAVETQRALFDERAGDAARERAHLAGALDQLDAQIAVLQEQVVVERRREEADAADLAVAQGHAEKGIYTQSRLADIRSAALISATRRLQTEAGLMALQRRRTEDARTLERLDVQRRLDTLDALAAAGVRREADRARHEATLARLRLAGLAPVPTEEGEPVLLVTPDRGGAETAVEPDRLLAPGDVVRVQRAASEAPLAAAPSFPAGAPGRDAPGGAVGRAGGGAGGGAGGPLAMAASPAAPRTLSAPGPRATPDGAGRPQAAAR
ncbi:polysaccharide biosynthesis/export family protein [Albimonas pacifica]|uniref:Polysaccharide export outer membrane protein n=1 Tax=Albimonas pacifica TaxID=1114924 RepID=A0A1I3IX65_9RHOB|nr:polysaccharide biosynthesis/export family protein [Albimonas pacifica]SFI52514.1 polysaccharide export outer membrane protein [Albimonas pacifica]